MKVKAITAALAMTAVLGTAVPARALSGAEYLGMTPTQRAIHVMGMVEAFKYAEDLNGGGRLDWLFSCAGGWSATRLDEVFTAYLESRPGDQNYRVPSLFVSAIGRQCPNAPVWAR